MKNLNIIDLETINAGGLDNAGAWDALISTGTVAAGSLAFLATGPASIPAALGAVALFNLGVIGSGVSVANLLNN